jgi:hypothetical protein
LYTEVTSVLESVLYRNPVPIGTIPQKERQFPPLVGMHASMCYTYLSFTFAGGEYDYASLLGGGGGDSVGGTNDLFSLSSLFFFSPVPVS